MKNFKGYFKQYLFLLENTHNVKANNEKIIYTVLSQFTNIYTYSVCVCVCVCVKQ